jgi:uncharacterized heparinase superfamily protein
VIRLVALYWHTLRHLRPRQMGARIWGKLPKSLPAARPAPLLRQPCRKWTSPARRVPSMTESMTFDLLNEVRRIRTVPWGADAPSALWRYNVHYFDDLNAFGASDRRLLHEEALSAWRRDNPPSRDDGWAPYPLSLRVVNWIKWCLSTGTSDQQLIDSLATQVRCLSGQLEYHLLGNHLFANAKALVFAGMFFQGSEADRWLDKGLSILAEEIPEQILPDGGQFERSPMYHSLAYEDLLDLINASNAFARAIPNRWRTFVNSWPDIARRMDDWLRAMTHPDGQIALFNDTAFGIAPSPAELKRYSREVGVAGVNSHHGSPIIHLQDSGYIRGEVGPAALFIDVAPLGPDYLPGHGHADSLSFELSVHGERLIVNGGTSRYGLGREREAERGTEAHSTVTVDGANSSEVWAGFRVARRAQPFDLRVSSVSDGLKVTCAHDGYRRLPGRPVHRRTWTLTTYELHVEDRIEGRYGLAVARFHLHPAVVCTFSDNHAGEFQLQSGQKVAWQVVGGIVSLAKSAYAPEFGRRIPTKCLSIKFDGADPVSLRLAW